MKKLTSLPSSSPVSEFTKAFLVYDLPFLFSDIKQVDNVLDGENGKEILVPLGECITEDEIRSFELFKSYCDDDFVIIESKKMATLTLDKYSDGEQGLRLLKSNRKV